MPFTSLISWLAGAFPSFPILPSLKLFRRFIQLPTFASSPHTYQLSKPLSFLTDSSLCVSNFYRFAPSTLPRYSHALYWARGKGRTSTAMAEGVDEGDWSIQIVVSNIHATVCNRQQKVVALLSAGATWAGPRKGEREASATKRLLFALLLAERRSRGRTGELGLALP